MPVMRLLSVNTDTGPTAAVLLGEDLVLAESLGAPREMRELLAALDRDGLVALAERAETSTGDRLALDECSLTAPVPDAQKIICVGLNYRDHAEETGQDIPQAPMWFAKFQNSLCGDGDDIVLPAAHAEYVDYEAELALVIGRTARKCDGGRCARARRGCNAVQRRQARVTCSCRIRCGRAARQSTPSLRAGRRSSRSMSSATSRT